MLVVSRFLETDIKPLIARMIYDPNETNIMGQIVDKLSQFGQKIPELLQKGEITPEHFQRYNLWLKNFLTTMEKQDYVKVLQGLNPKALK